MLFSHSFFSAVDSADAKFFLSCPTGMHGGALKNAQCKVRCCVSRHDEPRVHGDAVEKWNTPTSEGLTFVCSVVRYVLPNSSVTLVLV